jgi:hypothetical protein
VQLFVLILKILGAVAAVALGVWLGLPGRYEADLDEIERTMESGVGRTRKVKRRFTPLAWVQRKLSARGGGSQRRRGFTLERPEDR